MQYNTALGFLFFGLGLICINLEKLILGSFFGAITLLIGMITLAEYLWGLNTGLDELFMEGYVTVMTSHPGRMAPNTALCFLLSGLALVLVNPIHRKTKLIGLFQPLETFGAVITGLALVALVGYLFDIEYASGWGSQVRMAIHTSIGFCVVGFGLIIYKFPNLEEGGVPGLPVFLAVGLLVVSISFWKALNVEEYKNIESIRNNEVLHLKSLLTHRINQDILSLDRLKYRWQNRMYLNQEQWLKDARNYIKDKKELLAVEWVDENYIVRWLEPIRGNESAKDLDLSFEENRKRTLDFAKQNGKTQVTDVVEFVQGGLGFLIVSPIFAEDKFGGFILGVFEINKLLSSYAQIRELEGLSIEYYDSEKGLVDSEGVLKDSPSNHLQYRTQIDFRNISFGVNIIFEDSFFSNYKSGFPTVIGVAGILLSIIFSLLVYYNKKAKFHYDNIAKLADERNKLNEELRNLYNRVEKVREEERKHISREIHDELGQMLTAIKLDLSWLEKRVDLSETRMRDKVNSIYLCLDDSIKTVRRISTELRPQVLDVMGFCEALQWQSEKFMENTDVNCELHIEPQGIRVEPELSTDLFRVFQETLTNISRHSQAKNVKVDFFERKSEYELRVLDDGIGIDLAQINHLNSLGLLGIRERVLAWQGKVEIKGVVGEGTLLKVEIPKVNNGK